MMHLNIHLGAHKTASTYIQKYLRKNQEIIKDVGFLYMGVDDIRGDFTNAVNRLAVGKAESQDAAAVRDYVKKQMKRSSCTGCLMSDENLLGTPGEVFFQGQLYAKRRDRLRIVSDATAGLETKIFLSVRSFENFFPALYCEAIRHQRFVTFQEFVSKVDLINLQWTDIVTDIREFFPNSEIVIWPYEGLFNVMPRLVENLVGGDIFYRFSEPEKEVVRPSASHKAINVLASMIPVADRQEIKKTVWNIERAFPKGAEYDGFQPFSSVEQAYFRQRYSEDLAQIRQLEGITLLDG